MIFLDIDGVICDWNSGFCKLADIDYPEGDYISWDWAKYKIAPKSIWSYRMDSYFWYDLPLFPYGEELVKAVEEIDPNFRFLTSAPTNELDHSEFVQGRSKWISKNFGQKYLKKLIMTCGDKSFCASSDNWLIDDKEKNVLDFLEKGGNVFHWVECSKESKAGFKQTKQLINTLKIRIETKL